MYNLIGYIKVYRRLAEWSNVFHVWFYDSYIYITKTCITNVQGCILKTSHQGFVEI